MKYLLLLCSVLISLALANEYEREIKEALKLCQQSSGAPKDILSRNPESDDVPTLKDFLHCIFKGLNLFKPDSAVDSAKIEKMLPSDLTSEERNPIVTNCLSLRGANDADTSLDVYKCYKKYTNKVHFNLRR
ncbi:hypothetical protein AMK59_3535 [Oryctes borbonicus]|uniref:Odorant binding protein n=1 Tax=Oryctes borbonicus TaxID=1629725 RepID=A0A0T6B5E4_9SCAR|nr:hypothetical protein AMK59_3535 [Oryctes borbonicus]